MVPSGSQSLYQRDHSIFTALLLKVCSEEVINFIKWYFVHLIIQIHMSGSLYHDKFFRFGSFLVHVFRKMMNF